MHPQGLMSNALAGFGAAAAGSQNKPKTGPIRDATAVLYQIVPCPPPLETFFISPSNGLSVIFGLPIYRARRSLIADPSEVPLADRDPCAPPVPRFWRPPRESSCHGWSSNSSNSPRRPLRLLMVVFFSISQSSIPSLYSSS